MVMWLWVHLWAVVCEKIDLVFYFILVYFILYCCKSVLFVYLPRCVAWYTFYSVSNLLVICILDVVYIVYFEASFVSHWKIGKKLNVVVICVSTVYNDYMSSALLIIQSFIFVCSIFNFYLFGVVASLCMVHVRCVLYIYYIHVVYFEC